MVVKCRGLRLSGKRDELVKRVTECINAGNTTLDPSIDGGKWFAAKAIKESCEVQQSCQVVSFPDIPSTGWRVFPSHNIPDLFNYGHIHYYALESIQNVNVTEENDEGLGHMTDKPLKMEENTFIRDLSTT